MDYEVDMRNEGGPVSNSIKDLVLVDEMDLDSGVDCSRVFVEYLPLDHEDTLKLAHKSASGINCANVPKEKYYSGTRVVNEGKLEAENTTEEETEGGRLTLVVTI